jgi:hypothetical protein
MRILDLGPDYITRAIQRQHALDDADRAQYPGLHLSDIVHDFMKTMHPKWYETELIEEQKRALWELGNTFEDVMAQQLRRTLGFCKPEPRKVDGVWMSPDGHRPERKLIDEIKLTSCTARDGLDHPKLKKYLMQTLAYMYGYDAERGRIHVFFQQGDYTHRTKAGKGTPPLAMPKTYLILPTEDDIQHNKRMLWQHARDRRML